MEKYLGVKLIEGAKEMSRKEYCDYRGWDLPSDENGDDRVYLVEYEPSEDNSPNHPDHKGYISMSPKDVFEKAYRKIKTLDDLSNPFNNYDIDSSQWRTINEAKELDNKILQLENYLRIPELCANENEFNILKQQLSAMQYYLTILVERIENFK